MTQESKLDLAHLHGKVDRLTKVVERLIAGQKQDRKWRMIFRKQMSALIRERYIASGIAGPRALEVHRFRLRSQNEEDGITLALLRAVGVTASRFVEIGCGGTGGNSGVLAYELGWSGLMIDASVRAVQVATQLFKANPEVTVMRKTVGTENLNKVLVKAGMAGEVDFLSIDIDSSDYWLLDALEVVTPRVLVMEYNAHFGPERAVTVPNQPMPADAPKGYSGASLTALAACARRKGLRLVLCEDAGVNAFFVREDLAPDIPTLTPAQAWRPMADRFRNVGLREVDIYAMIDAGDLPLVEVEQ
jgi:hypothetical protein